jgi:hypothetical protein
MDGRMAGPSPTQILYPVFAMFYLVAFVLFRMGRMRFTAVARREMDPRFYATYDDGQEPPHMRVVTRHFINLFEVPVLFYVGAILAYVTDQVTYWLIGCAWLYVALRYVHTWVHLGTNDVLTRFRVYGASGIVLLVLWTSLLVQLLRA